MSGTSTTGGEVTPNGTQTPGTPPPATDASKIVFNSQADYDNALAERLNRKEASTRKALAEKLGVTPETLDDRIAALTKLEKDSLTDAERKVVEARAEATRETETRVRGELETKITKAQEAIIRAEVIQQATAAGFRHPEDVWARVKGDDKITIDAETFVVKGADKVIEAVKKDRPDWIGNTNGRPFGGSPPGGGGGPTTKRPGAETLEEMMAERRKRLTGGTRTRL